MDNIFKKVITVFFPKMKITNNRYRIIKSIIQNLNEKGFNNTTMKDIANSANVSEASIYKMFKSKKEIIDIFSERVLDYIYPVQINLKLKDILDNIENYTLERYLNEYFETSLILTKKFSFFSTIFFKELAQKDEVINYLINPKYNKTIFYHYKIFEHFKKKCTLKNIPNYFLFRNIQIFIFGIIFDPYNLYKDNTKNKESLIKIAIQIMLHGINDRSENSNDLILNCDYGHVINEIDWDTILIKLFPETKFTKKQKLCIKSLISDINCDLNSLSTKEISNLIDISETIIFKIFKTKSNIFNEIRERFFNNIFFPLKLEYLSKIDYKKDNLTDLTSAIFSFYIELFSNYYPLINFMTKNFRVFNIFLTENFGKIIEHESDILHKMNNQNSVLKVDIEIASQLFFIYGYQIFKYDKDIMISSTALSLNEFFSYFGKMMLFGIKKKPVT